MTQDELNGLIIGDLDLSKFDTKTDKAQKPQVKVESSKDKTNSKDDEIKINDSNFDVNHYRITSDEQWPPPPPIMDNRVVNQLDDVTKGLEMKAGEVFEKLEQIIANFDSSLKEIKIVKEFVDNQKDLLEKLTTQFPQVGAFKNALDSSNNAVKSLKILEDKSNEGSQCTIEAMDIMQYQDIHRQKIERVVNIMRTLAKYISSIFETDIDDSKRVSSATYIQGDKKDDLATSSEIEKLISDLGKK